MQLVYILTLIVLVSIPVTAQIRSLGNMCDDPSKGELCEYDYDSNRDRLTIHTRVEITSNGFAQSCSDSIDSDGDGVIDANDQDCLCGDPTGSDDQGLSCIGYAGDNGTVMQDTASGDGYYCDTSNGNICCQEGWFWDGIQCSQSDPCYQASCSAGNFTPAWYGMASCVDTSHTPTEACVYTGIQFATPYYDYVNVVPY
jgi:hypothetical protein